MKLSEILEAATTLVPFAAKGKWEAIEKLADSLVQTGKVGGSVAAELRTALFAREKSMSTGMEHGVAIPHAAIDGVDKVSAAMALAPTGIPFDSLDGKPAQILVCLVIPRQQKLLHIRTLAEIARLLSREPIRQRLLQCETASAVLDVVREEEKPK
jgi:mannitol/fructose-specific phosphotransferase system IIA component (Ntr-type)